MKRIRSLSAAFRSSVVLTGLAFAGCSSMITHFGGGVSKELQENGVVARATIQEIWDTGWTVNDNPVIGMKVLVLPPDRPAFTATIELMDEVLFPVKAVDLGGGSPVKPQKLLLAVQLNLFGTSIVKMSPR